MDRVLLACACGVRLDATKIEPGRKVRCPKCGASLLVPARAAAPTQETPEAPLPRRSRFEPKAAKRVPIVPVAAVAGAAVLGGALLLFSGGKEPVGASPAKAPPTAAAPGNPQAPKAPLPATAPAPAPEPKSAKRQELSRRVALAKEAGDAEALSAAAKFAEEAGLSGDALPVYEAILAIDADHAQARAALGFARYEGPAEEFRGKWLNARELARAKEAEAAVRAEAERWTKDEFMRKAASMKSSMGERAGEFKFKFFVDVPTVPRPYLIAAQESDVHPPSELAREVGRVLEALYAKFHEEYGEACGIKPVGAPVPVWVFSDKDEYEKAHERRPQLAPVSSKHVGGYYLGAIPVLVENEGERDIRTSGYLYLWNSEDLEGVAFHEGTHQLIGFSGKSRFFGGGQTPWFQEGIAEYWAGYEKKVDGGTGKLRFEIGHLTRRLVEQRWKLARTAFESGRPAEGEGEEEKEPEAGEKGEVAEMERFSLRGLVDFSYGDFQRVRASSESEKPDPKDQLKLGLVYAQGWALCRFLNKGLEGKYRRGFLRYVRAELEGEGGPEAFARCFDLKTDEDWARLEEEWETYVLGDLRKEALALFRR